MNRVCEHFSEKPKGVIVYMANRVLSYGVKRLKYSLYLLQENFNETHNYPVVIFHEDYGEKEKVYLQNDFSAPITFVRLNGFLELPSALSRAQVNRWIAGEDGGRKGAQLGYRHMCKFYSYPMLVHEALSEFDYYWRFDDDSFLIEKLTYDPFVRMEECGAIYGYAAKVGEDPQIKGIGFKDLLTLTKEFAKNHNLSLENLKNERIISFWKGYQGTYFYNNFEINKISFWREHDLYEKYFNLLDSHHGFQKHRWGDGNVRTLAVHLFLEMDQIYHFNNIPYRHNYHYTVADNEDLEFYDHGKPGDDTFENEREFCLNPKIY